MFKATLKILAISLMFCSALVAKDQSGPLPGIFTDHMVLQRDAKMPVWGNGKDGATVTVTVAGQTKTATVKDGSWKVILDPLKLSAEPTTMTVLFQQDGKDLDKIVLNDIVVGDIWFCGGQSNMAYLVGSKPPKKLADDTLLRHWGAGRGKKEGKPVWKTAVGENVETFSMTAYYFGWYVQNATKIPIGLVNISSSGTPVERWMPKKTYLANPLWKSYAEKYQDRDFVKEAAAKKQAISKDRTDGSDLDPFLAYSYFTSEAGNLWQVNVENHGYQQIPFKGVIYYQGEANARLKENARMYRDHFKALIKGWRESFGEGDPNLPFYAVQIPAIGKGRKDTYERFYEYIRQAQLDVIKEIPNTGIAVFVDTNEGLHPHSKNFAGERLAYLALKNVYKTRTECASGPLFDKAVADGSKMVCSFTETGSGLEAKGGKLQLFEIAGEDKKWVPAEAVIQGDTVVVSSAQVPAPKYVRYAFSAQPTPITLYNKEGIPASPFTSEDIHYKE